MYSDSHGKNGHLHGVNDWNGADIEESSHDELQHEETACVACARYKGQDTDTKRNREHDKVSVKERVHVEQNA